MKNEFELTKEQGITVFRTALLEIVEFLEQRGGKVEDDFDIKETMELVESSTDAQTISLMVRDGIVSMGRKVLQDKNDPKFLFRSAEIIRAYAEYVEALKCAQPLLPPELEKEVAGKVLN